MDDNIFDSIELLLNVNMAMGDTQFRRGIIRFETKEEKPQIMWYSERKKPGKELFTLLDKETREQLGLSRPDNATKLNFGKVGESSILTSKMILNYMFENKELVDAFHIPFCRHFVENAGDNEILTASSIYMWASRHAGNCLVHRLLLSFEQSEGPDSDFDEPSQVTSIGEKNEQKDVYDQSEDEKDFFFSSSM